MSKKVFLGVGHGGKDPGAVGYIKEADVNLNMALACRDYLTKNGVEVRMSRTRDEDDPISEEIKECNAFNPDLAVDVHNNAGGGDGFEVFYSHLGGVSKILAENIEAEVKAIGQNSRGLKMRLNSSGSDYYGFIRSIKAPSVICEGVFVDNAADAAQADTLEEQKMFGEAYAKGILKTLGLTDSGNVKQESSESASGSQPATVESGSFIVKLLDNMNIREKPFASSKVLIPDSDPKGARKGYKYTIVKVVGNWGQLKAYEGTNIGWINISEKYAVRC